MRLLTAEEIEALPEPERSEKLEQLRLLAQLREENPLQFFHCCPVDCGLPGCRPHPKQHEFLSSRDRLKAFFGGNRAGKTCVTVVDDLIQCVDADCLPDRLRAYKQYEPPAFVRIVTPDAVSTRNGVIEEIRKWCPRGQLLGGSFDTAYEKSQATLRFANGSQIDFKTFEQDRDKHGGTARHRVHHDEEPPGDIREENQARIISTDGDEVFSMTPLEGMTWMFDGVYERRYEDGITVVEAGMLDNPHNPRQAAERYLASLSGTKREARGKGRFVHFAGLVYPQWDDAVHLCDKPGPDVPKGWDTIVGIDPGIVGTGIVWVGFDSENVSCTYDELFLEGDDAIPENAAKQIRAKNKLWGVEPDFYVIDPAAAQRSVQTGETVEAAYQRAGIFPVPGNNHVEAGVFERQRKLVHRPPLHSVARTCTRLLWEQGRYRIDDRAQGKFQVVKVNDHEMDAERYVLMARPFPFETLEPDRPARTPVGMAPKIRPRPPTPPVAPTGALT